MGEEIKIKLRPQKRLFYDNASNYGIYGCITNEEEKVQLNDWGNFVVKGNMPVLMLDAEYIAKLKSEEDKQGRLAYIVQSIYEDIPTDGEKQKIYLQTILTENQVNELYKAYPDEDIITLIRENKIDVNKVYGIGHKTLEKIQDKIIETIEYKEALDFLGKYHISNNMIIKMVKHFKSAKLLIEKLNENPYVITEVHGIGFIKADNIALSIGYDPNGECRINAAIEHVIKEEENQGHTYITKNSLLKNVRELIEVEDELIKDQIKDTDNIIVLENKVALRKTYQMEKYVAEELLKRLNNSVELDIDIDDFIKRMEEKYDIQLTEQQKGFFHQVKKYNIVFLIGYAGTGKSMLQKLLIDLLEELNLSYALLAPTGKARKVLANYTNREAFTIHKATGLREDGETIIMLEDDVIETDESSMNDIRLSAKLLSRIAKDKARTIFIGDPFQIPSVGAGNFLHDSIESGMLPVTKLDIVFRQKEGGILDIATKVRLGEKFINNDFIGVKQFGDNCTLACIPDTDDKEYRIDKMVKGYQYFYKKYLEEYNPEDIFILTPTKKGELGTVSINQVIQNIINPKDINKKEIEYGNNTVFRYGDYVINTRNTYEIIDIHDKKTDIVNGDTGNIVDINIDENELIIHIDDKKLAIPKKMFDQILHSWSITMHKSQGSSSKVVIAILDKGHKFMSNANLIYTAFTRPEDYLIILTQAATLNFAMKKVANLSRNTFLKEFLLSFK